MQVGSLSAWCAACDHTGISIPFLHPGEEKGVLIACCKQPGSALQLAPFVSLHVE